MKSKISSREKQKLLTQIADLIEPKPKILSPEELREISSEVILITTQDFEIENVAENLAQNLRTTTVCFSHQRLAFIENFEEIKRKLAAKSVRFIRLFRSAMRLSARSGLKTLIFASKATRSRKNRRKNCRRFRRKIFFDRNEIQNTLSRFGGDGVRSSGCVD